MAAINEPPDRTLRMALVGGGGNAFIGPVHALAATLERRAELVAGALSADPRKAREAAAKFGIAPERAYASYHELIRAESELGADRRIDFVSVATPNDTHFEISHAALQAGWNVVCEKPLTIHLDQARALARRVEETGAVFAIMHNYTGYPQVRQAREMIRGGELGEIQAVRVHYIQSGLRSWEPGKTPARGAWKADPAKAGPSGTMADIGTHAFHLMRFTSGLAPIEIACQLLSFVPGRPLDDYGHVLVRFQNGALGTITVSQVTHGRLNDLALEVDGSTGSLTWRQEQPDLLVVRRYGRPVEIYERNPRVSLMHESARRTCRLPGGHPEGFLEAFANVYRDCFDHMLARAAGQSIDARNADYPNIYDGVEGVHFVEQCLASSRDNAAWKLFTSEMPRT